MEACNCSLLNSDSSENVAYNIKDFPVYIKKGKLSSYPDFRAISHWHDDLEFLLIIDGEMIYDVNGQKITLKPGEGLFVNSRCFHYGYSDTHKECNFICILFSPKLFSINSSFIETYVNPLIQNTCFPYQTLNPSIQWQNLILHSLKDTYENNIGKINPFDILEKTAHIFYLLLENMNDHADYDKNSDDIITLTAMIGYVQKNYQNKILLSNIYSAGNCCKTKCSMLFQKYLNTSPIIYLNQYRLEKSTYLLLNTKKTITEIAYECGFSSSSYYCEIFNKTYKTTPNNYRKKSFSINKIKN